MPPEISLSAKAQRYASKTDFFRFCFFLYLRRQARRLSSDYHRFASNRLRSNRVHGMLVCRAIDQSTDWRTIESSVLSTESKVILVFRSCHAFTSLDIAAAQRGRSGKMVEFTQREDPSLKITSRLLRSFAGVCVSLFGIGILRK